MDEEERSIITSLGVEVEWIAALGCGDRVGWRMGGEMQAALGLEAEDG